jgi:hypothetical protein
VLVLLMLRIWRLPNCHAMATFFILF